MNPVGRTWLLAATLALAGCALAPHELAAPSLRAQAPLAGVPVDSASRWPAADWWKRFDDPQLDDLEARALRNAPSLASARSRYQAAVTVVDQARAQGGLDIDANAQVQRQRLSENGLIPPQLLGFTWYNQGDLGLQISYDFDFWGRKRAAVEAAVDRARAAQAESNAAAAMLTSSVADTYFGWQGDQARLALTRQALDAQRRIHDIVLARTRRGIEDPDDLREATAAVAQAEEHIDALKGSAHIHLVALAALLGVAPADLPTLAPRMLPPALDGVPADATLDLIARRPDIAASRWRVEATAQDVKQARAAFFPDFSLKALLGFSSIRLDKWINAPSRVFDVAPAVNLPIFEGGSLRAQYGVTRAQLHAAIADYDQTVVNAAREVATQAFTLDMLTQRAHEQTTQVAAQQRLRDTAAARAGRGLTDARPLLVAQTQWLQQRDAAMQLGVQQLSAEITLINALGGGFHDTSREQSAGHPSSSTEKTIEP